MITSYLTSPVDTDTRKACMEKAIEALGKIEFDTIAVRGVSGLVMGPTLAYLLNKNLCIVRKSGERSHAFVKVERIRDGVGRYVIVDDLVNSGKTVCTVIREIKKDDANPAHSNVERSAPTPPPARPVGIYTYDTQFYPQDVANKVLKALSGASYWSKYIKIWMPISPSNEH